MNRKLIFIVLTCVVLIACKQNRSADDTELLKRTLTDYFDGISNKDFLKMKQATTSDFILFEDGRVWNNDSAFSNIRKHVPFTVKYTLTDLKIQIDQNSGYAIYDNHADFVFDGQEETIDWIESAIFIRTKEGWRMNFLHLTERK